MKYSANGNFIYKKTTTGLPGHHRPVCLQGKEAGPAFGAQSLIKEHFDISVIENWSADNLIYTTDGKVGIGTRDPRKKLHINGDIKTNNLCLTNENGDEECINFAFILLAKELILGIMPKEYRDFEKHLRAVV